MKEEKCLIRNLILKLRRILKQQEGHALFMVMALCLILWMIAAYAIALSVQQNEQIYWQEQELHKLVLLQSALPLWIERKWKLDGDSEHISFNNGHVSIQINRQRSTEEAWSIELDANVGRSNGQSSARQQANVLVEKHSGNILQWEE